MNLFHLVLYFIINLSKETSFCQNKNRFSYKFYSSLGIWVDDWKLMGHELSEEVFLLRVGLCGWAHGLLRYAQSWPI